MRSRPAVVSAPEQPFPSSVVDRVRLRGGRPNASQERVRQHRLQVTYMMTIVCPNPRCDGAIIFDWAACFNITSTLRAAMAAANMDAALFCARVTLHARSFARNTSTNCAPRAIARQSRRGIARGNSGRCGTRVGSRTRSAFAERVSASYFIWPRVVRSPPPTDAVPPRGFRWRPPRARSPISRPSLRVGGTISVARRDLPPRPNCGAAPVIPRQREPRGAIGVLRFTELLR